MGFVDLAQALVSGLLIGAVYALIGVGLTLIWGVMDVVNFAHGNFLMLAMYAAYFQWALWHFDPLLAVPLGVLALIGLCLAVHFICIRPLLGGSALSQMIATFGLLILIQGLAQMFFSPASRTVVDPLLGTLRFELGGIFVGGPQLGAAAGALLSLAVVWWILARTDAGAAIDAVAQDRDAAQLVGINPDRIYVLAWVITGASLGVAGALLMNAYSVDPASGFLLGLIGFVVVCLGGFGSVRGALVAGLLMGVVQVVAGLYAPAYGFATIFVVYLGVVLLRPQGLFGTR